MLSVTAAEFQRNIGRYQDEALKQPVSITRNGRERLVVMAVEEYQRLKRRDREVRAATELRAAEIEAISRTEMDPRHAHLDDQLK
jgi:prevent-host-death family protein